MCGASAATLAMPAAAFAQADPAAPDPAAPVPAAVEPAPDTAANEGMGEIVVTARSRGETLTAVPVSVTAYGGEELAKYNTTDLTKVAQLTPQVEIYGGGAGSGGAFLIRGIGTTADTAGVDQSVSLSIDGTQIARPRTVFAGMFDLQQLAILKGPQALFFGKNSSAGVVSIQSANPTADLSGYVTGGYEFKARERYVEAAVSVPITDTLGVRFAGRYSKLRGWVENIAVPRVNPIEPTVILPGAGSRWGPGSENRGGRITVQWEPSSNYTSVMKATFLGYEDNGGTSTAEPVCAPGTRPTTLGLTDPLSDCRLDGKVARSALPPEYSSGPLGDRRWFNGIPFTDMSSMLLTWQQTLDLDAVTLTSNTGYSELDFITRDNYNNMMFSEFAGGVTERFRGWSQEVRAITNLDGPFNVTVGGYYEDTKNYHSSALFLLNAGRDPDTGSYQAGFNESNERTEAWSVFGQARYDIVDNLELAVGARYTKTKKRATQGQPRFVHAAFDSTVLPNVPGLEFLLPEGQVISSRLNEDNTSPEATLTWYPTPNQTLYGALKTGYKSGGIALPSLVTVADNSSTVVFNPEKAKGGEIGYKANLLDRSLRVGATLYYYKFTGLQLTSFDAVTSSYRIQNAADAKQKGVELEADYRVTNEFSVRGSANYNSVKYGDFENSSCYSNQTVAQGCVGGVQDLSGRRIHRAPEFAGTIGASYESYFGEDLAFALSGDLKYTSSSFVTEQLAPLSKQEDYVLINASIRVFPDSKDWELALIGRNLTNERLYGFAQDKPGAITPGVNELNVYGSRPREVALQGTVRF